MSYNILGNLSKNYIIRSQKSVGVNLYDNLYEFEIVYSQRLTSFVLLRFGYSLKINFSNLINNFNNYWEKNLEDN